MSNSGPELYPLFNREYFGCPREVAVVAEINPLPGGKVEIILFPNSERELRWINLVRAKIPKNYPTDIEVKELEGEGLVQVVVEYTKEGKETTLRYQRAGESVGLLWAGRATARDSPAA